MNEVFLSAPADSDLVDIWTFVANDDPVAANRLLDQIGRRFLMLARNPEAGRLRPDLRRAIRSFPVSNYVVFYRIVDRGIEVVRVLHGHRDIQKP